MTLIFAKTRETDASSKTIMIMNMMRILIIVRQIFTTAAVTLTCKSIKLRRRQSKTNFIFSCNTNSENNPENNPANGADFIQCSVLAVSAVLMAILV